MDLEGLKNWSKKQGYILTGGGILESRMLPDRDYKESDLAHYHLRNKSDRAVFARWLRESRRSMAIVGAWRRPLFSGGWAESTDLDTQAFNLQTPSIFIDLRFPVDRPPSLRRGGSLSGCSVLELRKLARQHCFAGYTYPELGVTDNANAPVFTRHHVIDWNYHPGFPRTRPNRWRAEIKDDKSSFKEFSTAVDEFGVPVYFERWTRYPEDGMGNKYFAARCIGCTGVASEGHDQSFRDAFLVVVGNHFAVAIDRPPVTYVSGEGVGGGPSWVDCLSQLADQEEGKRRIESYLDLCGIYGCVNTQSQRWKIVKSTHPWLESSSYLCRGDTQFILDENEEMGFVIEFKGHKWSILENNYSRAELDELFMCAIDNSAASVDPWPSESVSATTAAIASDSTGGAKQQFEMLLKLVSEPTLFRCYNDAEQKEMTDRLKELALGI